MDVGSPVDVVEVEVTVIVCGADASTAGDPVLQVSVCVCRGGSILGARPAAHEGSSTAKIEGKPRAFVKDQVSHGVEVHRTIIKEVCSGDISRCRVKGHGFQQTGEPEIAGEDAGAGVERERRMARQLAIDTQQQRLIDGIEA